MRPELAAILARPIAHRGLHDRMRGIVENSVSAATAAIAQGFGIECDIQITADGQAVIFHDDTLERLTLASGRVDARTAADLTALSLRESADRVSTLPAFLSLIAGRVPLVIEIKSRFDRDLRLAACAVHEIGRYSGPVALKSFDPIVMAECCRLGALCPLGLVGPSKADSASLADFDFLSWDVHAIHDLAPSQDRGLMSWTVRDSSEENKARHHRAQIIFENYTPSFIY